ncbi:PTS sugar transporter subunit IIB [Agrococcus versicolor]|jgi:PTS system galactitol-specific IIB component|uniref:PTS sugar transporter subunit IIB n=1 Tax=Agrococcus versicolor TaxID=501482 RepID=A0ABN3AS57_9MICO
MSTKRILVICGTGVATSTVVVQKVRAFCESEGIQATISQGAVADLLTGTPNADLIVATTQVPDSVQIPVVAGLPFLTGIGVDGVHQQLRAHLA